MGIAWQSHGSKYMEVQGLNRYVIIVGQRLVELFYDLTKQPKPSRYTKKDTRR
jgi:hypothetical protein